MLKLFRQGYIFRVLVPDIFHSLPIVDVVMARLVGVYHVQIISYFKELVEDHSFGTVRLQTGVSLLKVQKLLPINSMIYRIAQLFPIIVVMYILMQQLTVLQVHD